MPGTPLERSFLVRRAAQELFPGAVVALGMGIPCYLPGELPNSGGVWFIADSGVLGIQGMAPDASAVDTGGNPVTLLTGGAYTGVVDTAGILRGGHTDIAVLQPSQVAANGDFVHWTTEATHGLFAAGSAVDMAYGASKLVAIMTPQRPDGRHNNLERCALPVVGARKGNTIIYQSAV